MSSLFTDVSVMSQFKSYLAGADSFAENTEPASFASSVELFSTVSPLVAPDMTPKSKMIKKKKWLSVTSR